MRLLGLKYATDAFVLPRTTLEELTTLPESPDPLAGFGATLWWGEQGTREEERRGEGRGGEGKGRKGKRRKERGGEGPLKLHIPGSFFYPSPPLMEITQKPHVYVQYIKNMKKRKDIV